MNGALNEATSLYLQIAAMIEDQILRGLLLEEEQAPSTNELARLYRINPATAAKGLNLLTDEGVLYKKRGIGMFAAPGSRERIIAKRKTAFYESYVKSIVAEAQKLGIDRAELEQMLARAASENGGNKG
ncbi:MAG: GntR family transcriptional regulator [Subdoligranulum sp.]|nr:GntR family transcriptional regulator [Subdoligranulum sp.]